MTREEAIAYGKDYYRDLTTACCEIDKKHKEFVKMSIKALEQEPCDDVISRKAVIQTLNKMDRYTATELTLCDTDKKFPANEVFIVDDVYEQIAEQLPSVRPKEQTGKWIKLYMSDTGEVKYECSLCGFVASEKWKYCCECGARMVEPQERSDKE